MPIFFLPLFTAALRLASVLSLATAAASDIDRRIISNRVSLLVSGLGALLRFAIEPRGFALSVLAAIAVYLGLAVLAHLKFLGGGDVKLAAAATFFVRAIEVPALLLDIAIVGGVLCFGFLIERRASRSDRLPVPYGVAISIATAYRVIVDLLP